MHVRNVAARNMTIISQVSVLFVMLSNIGVLVVDDIVYVCDFVAVNNGRCQLSHGEVICA